MNYNVLYFLGELPTPVIITIISLVIWKNPPCFGENFGYRTKRSQSSKEAWLFAQITWGKQSTITFAIFTAATVVLGFASIKANFDEITGIVVFAAHTVLLLILQFVTIGIVEGKLKTAFDEHGEPKL